MTKSYFFMKVSTRLQKLPRLASSSELLRAIKSRHANCCRRLGSVGEQVVSPDGSGKTQVACLVSKDTDVSRLGELAPSYWRYSLVFDVCSSV